MTSASRPATVFFGCFVLARLCAGESISVEGYESGLQRHFQFIADEVWRIAKETFRIKPPLDLPIVCRYGASGPVTRLDDWIHPSRIEIGISTVGPYDSQFVYQLGHELGHVMLNPRRSNALIEAIATAVSYEVLDQLSEKWKTKAPFEYARVHADEFRKYRERAEREAISRAQPLLQQVIAEQDWEIAGAYLADHMRDFELTEKGMKSQPARDWQSLAAIVFRAAKTDWPRLARCAVPEPGLELGFRYQDAGPCQYGMLR